jgi:Fic family protein|tara:strand:+ start:1087 stop:1572 length:486 start_codon:yes stop_codon:yes gene_type:complete
MDKYLVNFIKESNKIEGILQFKEEAQYEAYTHFINCSELTVKIIEDFALLLYQSSFDKEGAKPEVRKKGYDVRVGNYTPPKGGPGIIRCIERLLTKINSQTNSKLAYKLHCEYENLHPLTDCNGRTGRAIWAWLMLKDDYSFILGFLHKWYYQSLDQRRIQ